MEMMRDGEAALTAPGPKARIALAATSSWMTQVLALGCFVNMVSTLALSPFLPIIADELGASVALLGQIPSVTMLLAALVGLVSGPLGDRYGYRRSVVVGLLTTAASGLGIALAPELLPLFVAGLLGAVGRAVVMPTAQAIVSSSLKEEQARRQAISWIATGTTAAPLVGIPLLALIADATHWRVSFTIVGATSLLMALALWCLLPSGGATTRGALRLRDVFTAYEPLLRHRSSVGLILASLVTNVGTWATFTYMAAFFVVLHGYSTSEVGGTYLVCGIGTVLGTRVVGSRLGMYPRHLLIGGRVLGGLAVMGALAPSVPPLAALGLLAFAALASTMGMASSTVLLASDAPGGRGTALTLHSSALSLGTALGAAVGGLLLAIADFQTVGVVSMACYVASATIVWCLHTPARAED